MHHFRVRYMTALAIPHVYCRMFVARRPKATYVAVGSLTMRKDEFAAFRECFRAEFIDENAKPES